MRDPTLLIAAIAAAFMALAPLGVSQAATVPAPHEISLHVSFTRALPSARVGHIAGSFRCSSGCSAFWATRARAG
jgi:hypothetical protein